MRRYPLKLSDFVTPEDAAAGRTYVKMPYADYVHFVNNAFFAGFELGSCETAEEFKSITVQERCALTIIAKKMMDELFADVSGKGALKNGNSAGT